MSNNLGLLREFDVINEIQSPHLMHKNFSFVVKQKIAYSILSRKANEILLLNGTGFSEGAVFAGLSEKHIEYIAIHAPREYKEELISLIKKDHKRDEIGEIAKAMDEDLGGGSVRHQTRVKNVIQYIKDNQVVFEF